MRASEVISNREAWQARMTLLRRWLALCGLVLIAATWRLWTPQDLFPQVPFLAALRDAPAWLDWLALIALLVSLVGLLAAPSIFVSRPRPPATAGGASSGASASTNDTNPGPSPQGEGNENRRVVRAFVLLLVASLALLVMLDQHRLQVWAYQFSIVAIVLAFASPLGAVSLLRVLVVGIYFWSAVSKIDYTFLNSIGPDLLKGLLTGLQLDPGRVDAATATRMAWLFPIGELAAALLLALRRTRTIGLVLSIVMHLGLIVTLGPLGLNHEAGVLLWNLYFIGQNLLLFLRPKAGWHRAAGGRDERVRFWQHRAGWLPSVRSVGIEHVAVGLAIGLPILEPFGLIDHWPAWAVYTPGAERVTLLIDATAAERLPEELQRHLGPIQFATDARVLRTDLWSFDALAVPIYPQKRFRMGVALAVIERNRLEDAATVVVESRADRFNGKRERWTLPGAAIRVLVESTYVFNALPAPPWAE